MMDYQPLRNALICVENLIMGNPFLTGEQARACVIVEYTPKEEPALRMNCVSENAFYNHEGPITLCGIRFYRVDTLKDGDTWRVRNALGTI